MPRAIHVGFFEAATIRIIYSQSIPSQRSIQSCPAGQLHNSKEVGRTKTKDLSSYFLERRRAERKRNGQTARLFPELTTPGAVAPFPPLRAGECFLNPAISHAQ